MEVVKKRVESGSEMSVGPSGFTLGPVPRLEEQESSEDSKSPEEVIADYTEETKKRPPSGKAALELAKYFRLVHSASYNTELTQRAGRPYYTIKVWLDTDSSALLDRISKVVYHLHPTFPNPDREISTRSNNFELKTNGWGQFNLTANVYFKEGEQSLRLSRYIDF